MKNERLHQVGNLTAKTISILVIMLFCSSLNVKAQNVSTYTFTQTSETYTAITGGTTLIDGNQDTYCSALTNIGFDFIYHGVAFTQFSASSNGYICLGGIPTSNNNPLRFDVNSIAFCAIDGKTNGVVTYLLSGTAPNRILTIQYPNWYLYYSSTSETLNAQIKLYETSNLIKIIYGSSTHNSSSYQPQVGLTGSSVTDFNNRITSSNWSATSAGTTNAATMYWSSTSFPANGLTYIWAPPACSGTPIPGNVIASANPVCSGQIFALSLSNIMTNVGLNFQWQYSNDEVGWFDIPGATSATYSASQAFSRYYRCYVTCTISGLSAYSSTLYVPVPSHCYCVSSAIPAISNSDIINITLGTLNNSSTINSLTGTQGMATGTAGMYSDWRVSTVPIPSVEKGSAVPFTSTIGGTTNFYRVDLYIDFNRDGDFSDANESFGIFQFSNHTSPNIISTNIIIPLSSDTGTTVMRVIYTESSFSFPCGAYSNGETEDYLINITDAPACSGTPIGGTATASTTLVPSCTGYSGAISVTGSSVNSGLTYQWQSSSTGSAPWIDIVGAVEEKFTVLTPGLYYRRALTCINSGLSGFSSSLLFANSAPANDECGNAQLLTVNLTDSCYTYTTGTVACATASPELNYCQGYNDDDVWYKFIATNSNHTISLSNISGVNTDMYFAVYGGTCDSLTNLACSDANKATIGGLFIGETYYVRVYTSTNNNTLTTTFNICVSVPVSITVCDGARPFCTGITSDFPATINAGDAQIGPNYGCLTSVPNPTWFYMKIATAGDLIFTMTNSALLDIDFACWGPFTEPVTPCSSSLTATGSNWGSDSPHGTYPYPYGNLVDCSFNYSSSEICGIPNATVGQYYLLMITNYSNMPTNILFSQTGGTGSADCSFVDPPITSNSPLCVGKTLQLTVSDPIPGATYAWTGPNGFTSSVMNPSIPNITSTGAGVYSMVSTVGGVPNAAVITAVVVNSIPVVGITNNTGSAVLTCMTTPINLTAFGGSSYLWSDESSTASNSITLPSTYTVTVTAANGCSATSTIAIVQNITPPTPTVFNNGPICVGENMSLSANGGASYAWSGPNGFTSSLQNPTINDIDSMDAGVYSVTVTGTNGCTATGQTTVILNPMLVAQFTHNAIGLTVTFTNTSIGATSYLWNFGSDTSTEANPVYTFPSSGQYPVQLTANNQGCASATTVQAIFVSDIGVSVIDRKSMTIYPNPMSDKLIIEVNGFTETIHFEILNSMGQVVFKGDFADKTIVQTANFAPGVYLVKLMNGERFMLKKIIKE